MNFLSKIKLLSLTCVLFLVACTRDYMHFQAWDDGSQPAVVLTSATVEDLHCFKALMEGKACPSGLPAEDILGNWYYEQHLQRIEQNNAYHLYVVTTQCGKRLGYVQLGVMPVLGYCPTKHCAIINKWISLGVLARVNDPVCSFGRVDNRGLAFILPVLQDDLERGEEVSAIKASVEMLKCFRADNRLLPHENTLPYQVIGLFKPSNDLIDSFEAAGFKVDDNEGFYQFYHKDRVMVTKPLDVVEVPCLVEAQEECKEDGCFLMDLIDNILE